MKRKAMALLLCTVLGATLLTACGSGGAASSAESAAESVAEEVESTVESTAEEVESEVASTAEEVESEVESVADEVESAAEEAPAGDYPVVDLLNDKVWGDVGPDGSVPAGLADVMLSDEEIEQVRAGNYKVAICYHQLDNQVNQSKLASTLEVFKDLNIEVVCTTDAQSDANKEVDDIDSAFSLNPDLLLSMPYDVEVTKAAYQRYMDAGIPVVFMENASSDFKVGEDYVCVTNSDSYGNGMYAAMLLAEAMNYEGECAMVYYDADFFTTNERDRAFRETMAKYYPNITIVEEFGFTSIDVVGTVADGMFAKYPNIKGVYASWDIPAADVITSARAIGREDLLVTGVDLGDESAYMIATNDMYIGTGCPKATETGKIEAYACARALLGLDVPTYLVSSSQPVCYENVLDAYQICFDIDAPAAIKEAWEKNQ